MSTVTIDVVAEVAKATSGIDQVDGKLSGLEKRGSATRSVMGGMLAADLVSKAGAMIGDSIGEAYTMVQEQGKLAAQTEAVLKSTGGAAGVTASAIDDLSSSLETKSLIDAETIQNGANLMLTFTNVKNAAGDGNDVFNQSIGTMTDMATALGTDTTSAATMLGKALNDPIAGVGALSRVGVTFTDQQKDQIKALVESGDTMGAQKVILGELSKEFGGSAAAAGATFPGAMKHAKDAVDGVIEGAIKPMLPVLQQGAEWFAAHLPEGLEIAGKAFTAIKEKITPFVDALGAGIQWLKDNPETFKAFAITVGILGAALGVVVIAQWAWNVAMTANPIGLIIVGIGLLVAAIVWVVTHWDLVKAKVLGVLTAVGYAIFGFVDGVKTWFTNAVTNAVEAFTSFPDKVGNILAKLPGMALEAGKDLVRGIANGIGWAADLVWKAAENVAGKAIEAIKKTLGIASPSKVGTAIGDNFVSSQGLGMERAAPGLFATARSIAGKLTEAAVADPTGVTFTSKAGSNPNGAAGATYNINVTAGPGTDRIALGREIVDLIDAYERANGGRR